jgi:xylulose-5-phosphate/fructose-6-phosphate phosphoketolase
LSCFDHCIRSKNYVNVIVASKHPRPQWLCDGGGGEALHPGHRHLAVGVHGSAARSRTCHGLLRRHAHAGDAGGGTILRREFPELKIRVVNVVDLMRLQSNEQHPHGLTQQEYDAIFTVDKPILFAYHGYPSLIHELTYKREEQESGMSAAMWRRAPSQLPSTCAYSTGLDRFNLVQSAVYNLPQLGNRGAYLIQQMKDKLVEHRQYIAEYGVDLPEVADWKWTAE